VSKPPQVGQRRLQQTPTESAAAMRACNACRAEESQSAIVRIVRGEACDLVIHINIEERRRIVLERASGLEAPDAPELLFDERKHALGCLLRRAEHTFRHLRWQLRRDEILRRGDRAVLALHEKINRRNIARGDAGREVVARLGGHDLRTPALARLAQERAPHASPASRAVDCEDAKERAAGDADACKIISDAHLGFPSDAVSKTLLLSHASEVVRAVVGPRQQLHDAGKIVARRRSDHAVITTQRGKVDRRRPGGDLNDSSAHLSQYVDLMDEIVRCASCGQANRLPPVGSGSKAVCGKCKAPLTASNGHPIDVTDANLAETIRNGSYVVDFWAAWCGPCRMIAPILDEMAASRTDVRFLKLNVDQNPRAASQYRAMSIPLLVFFKDGIEKGRVVGAVPRGQIEAAIKQYLG